MPRSRGQKKPSLTTLSREPLAKEDKPATRAELLRGTDRSSALIGCALVDASLVSALTTRFVSMDETEHEELFYSRNATLHSFSTRIQVGKAIGVFGDRIGEMLDSIRRIRNVFAHSTKPLTFDHPLIAKECEKLPDATLDGLFKIPPKGLNPHRERFVSVCMNLVILIEDQAERHAETPITIGIPDSSFD